MDYDYEPLTLGETENTSRRIRRSRYDEVRLPRMPSLHVSLVNDQGEPSWATECGYSMNSITILLQRILTDKPATTGQTMIVEKRQIVGQVRF